MDLCQTANLGSQLLSEVDTEKSDPMLANLADKAVDLLEAICNHNQVQI